MVASEGYNATTQANDQFISSPVSANPSYPSSHDRQPLMNGPISGKIPCSEHSLLDLCVRYALVRPPPRFGSQLKMDNLAATSTRDIVKIPLLEWHEAKRIAPGNWPLLILGEHNPYSPILENKANMTWDLGSGLGGGSVLLPETAQLD